MISHPFIELSPTSQIRRDAKGTLIYTLLLDFFLPSIKSSNPVIPAIMESCHQCCSRLIDDTGKHITYNFFGMEDFYNKEFTTFSYLDSPSISPADAGTLFPYYSRIGFHTMILQHCLFSSYHAILSELLHDLSIESYTLVNGVNGLGVQGLLNKREISFNSKKDCMEMHFKKKEDIHNKKKSSLASDFYRCSETHKKNIPDVDGFFAKSSDTGPASIINAPHPDTDKTTKEISEKTTSSQTKAEGANIKGDVSITRTDNSLSIKKGGQTPTFPEKKVRKADCYPIQFAGIYYKICGVRSSQWRDLFKPLTKVNCSAKLNKITKIPEDIFKDHKSNEVDLLYHHYLIERIFNFDLINCLIQNIHRIQSMGKYNLCWEQMLDTLCCCQELPNTFSRHHFVQYAFDKFITEPNSVNDFWHVHTGYITNNAIAFTPETLSGFQITSWVVQYRHFCKFMSSFLIPIYEWCFLILLLEYVEKEMPKVSHRSHLIQAMDILKNYIQSQYKEISDPLPPPKKQAPKKKTQKEIKIIKKSDIDNIDLPPDVLDIIFKNVYRKSRELNLGLTHFNKDFFTSGGCRHIPYATYLRDFILNRLKDQY